ncbi:MAG: hypothetical protein FWF59_12585 [Turicibacter sp.]|nr:hypothetical protein [Turicibacter sp.]
MKKIIIGLVALLVIGGLASTFFPSVNSTRGLPFINYQEAFTQEPAEYFVYFYNTDCSFCQQLEPSIMEAHRAGVPIFVVDVRDPRNNNVWYDWDGHHEQYDVVVGEIIDGEEVFHDDFDAADFPEGDWSFAVVGTEIVAQYNRAYNNTNPTSPEEIDISGTPSMMHIVNGQAVAFDIGVEQAKQMLASYSGLEAPLFE